MNRGELKTEVFRRLDESATSPIFWEVQDVEDALHEATEELADATEFHEVSQPLSLVQDQQYYNMKLLFCPHDPDFGNEPLRITAVYNNQTGTWLKPVLPSDLDAIDSQWGRVRGEPQYYFMRGLWMLGVFPKSAVNAGTLTVYSVAIPLRMALDTDVPPFPFDFHPGLIEYALYDLLSQDGETKEALEHWKAYQMYEAWLAEHVAGRTRDRVGRFSYGG